jgi:hypothetical protein
MKRISRKCLEPSFEPRFADNTYTSWERILSEWSKRALFHLSQPCLLVPLDLHDSAVLHDNGDRAELEVFQGVTDMGENPTSLLVVELQ